MDAGSLSITVTTAAGAGVAGYRDGDAGSALFNSPNDIVFASDGTAYIADFNNNIIRSMTSEGVVSTLAGTGAPGSLDGPAATAQFNNPAYLVLDSEGNLLVIDWGDAHVRKIAVDGTVSTLAGAAAGLSQPGGITVDSNGLVYVADAPNNRIVTIATDVGATTLTGGPAGFDDGPLASATFNYPNELHFDGVGNLYVADRDNCAIRIISPEGMVSTLVGRAGCGFADGDVAHAELDWPIGMVLPGNGQVYVVDVLNQRIRSVDASGNTTTIAGNGVAGYIDGQAATAEFDLPIDMSADSAGNLYLTDRVNNVIRKISFTPTP